MIELTKHLFPSVVKGGLLKQGEHFTATVSNKSNFDLESYYQGCGCLGTITMTDRELHFDMEAAAEHCKPLNLFTDGDTYIQAVPVADKVQYLDIKSGQYLSNIPSTLTAVNGLKFSKEVPIRFKDGETDKKIVNGRLLDNESRHSATITVIYYMIKEN